jgi:hypothetical protein
VDGVLSKKMTLKTLFTISIFMIMNSLNAQLPIQENGHVVRHGKCVYTDIIIKASVEKVWTEFTNFETYSTWNPFIKKLNGPIVVGQKIEALICPPDQKPMTFKPRVLVYEKEREFRWVGKLFIGRLFDGEHVFQLIDNGDGTTTFRQYEYFRGLLVPFLKKMLNTNTKQGFESMNVALKERCEK